MTSYSRHNCWHCYFNLVVNLTGNLRTMFLHILKVGEVIVACPQRFLLERHHLCLPGNECVTISHLRKSPQMLMTPKANLRNHSAGLPMVTSLWGVLLHDLPKTVLSPSLPNFPQFKVSSALGISVAFSTLKHTHGMDLQLEISMEELLWGRFSHSHLFTKRPNATMNSW